MQKPCTSLQLVQRFCHGGAVRVVNGIAEVFDLGQGRVPFTVENIAGEFTPMC